MDNKQKKHRFDSIKDALEHFEKKNECHHFLGSFDGSHGYGIFRVGNITYRAHRAAYELYNGIIISKDKFIYHKCNMKTCINPDHLYAATRKDNARDRMINLNKKEKHGKIEINKNNISSIKQAVDSIHIENKKFTMIFPQSLYDQLKIMCVITRKSLSDFIRISVVDKINELRTQIN